MATSTKEKKTSRRARLWEESDVVYPWRIPEKGLEERKMVAERRREDLLQMIYEESLTPEQIEQLIREWISLVTERDQLLREEIEKENKGVKAEYLQDLRRFLHRMPTLDGSSDDVRLKDALLTLERQVTDYCHSHSIGSPPYGRPPIHSLARHGTGAEMDTASSSTEGTPTCPSTLDVPDGPVSENASLSANPFQPSYSLSNPLHQVPPFGSFSPAQRSPSKDVSSVPPPPPPPPPIVPLSGGVMGTVQFSGAKRPDILPKEAIRNPSKRRSVDPDGKKKEDAPARNDELTKGLMEEITSIGQKNLRSIERPRSPGGTPAKMSRRLTLSSNTDMLQRALISKFRSLHSTPIRQGSTTSDSSTFDFSNAWSDINSSVDFEDPDITASNLPSDLVNGSDPNASRHSTAV